MRLPTGYGTVYKLSGNRRKPFIVRKTIGWKIDEETGKSKQIVKTIGYAKTKTQGLQMLADYNNNPYDIDASNATFKDVYDNWSSQKFPTISHSGVLGYQASYSACSRLYDKTFKDIRLNDLQYVIDSCNKNYPTLRKIRILFNQLYEYAMKNEICFKDYSKFVDIAKFKDKNPNKYDRKKFTKQELNYFWEQKDNQYSQILLMLIYSGVRISELLDLETSNVHLDEQYFDVVESKTSNGIRKVPIADKVLPFYKQWFNSDNKYLLHTENKQKFTYRNYYDSYYKPIMEMYNIKDRTPHCTRHTCVSMLAEAGVDQTTIKKIVGHSGAMSLTEKVYTHLDIQQLVDAINKI